MKDINPSLDDLSVDERIEYLYELEREVLAEIEAETQSHLMDWGNERPRNGACNYPED
jgi:hypothetical protein